jgi:hypothetical protein
VKKGVLIGVIAGVVLILIAGFFILTNNGNNSQKENANPNQMVDCGKMTNLACFSNRMSSCLPVTSQLTATDGITKIDVTILGYENQTCHFQRKVNSVINLNCYFPAGTNMTWDLIDQTFGNDKGLQNIVDENCKAV